MEKEFLTAEQARTRADTSLCLKNRVYKCIKDLANENVTCFSWRVKDLSKKAIDDLKAQLLNDGYDVEYEKICDEFGDLTVADEDTLIIKW